jgi:hypothetical protein
MTNESPASKQMVIRHKTAGEETINTESTSFVWPDKVYSLSHIALPTPEDDPLYGGSNAKRDRGELKLGALALRGERGVLLVSSDYMLRQHWNPFYPYLEQRVLDFVHLPAHPAED